MAIEPPVYESENSGSEVKTASAASPAQAPSPRAFAQGTGLVLQTVGALMLMTNCCVCSLSFLWDPIRTTSQEMIDADAEATSEAVRVKSMLEEPHKAGMMLTIVTATVGGLAMAGFGLGLQSDRRQAAWGAAITCTLVTMLFIVAGVGLWTGEGTFNFRIWHGILTLIAGLTVIFTIGALRQVIANPPPANVDILPADYKIPYSMYHEDPPDVRLARDIARKRARLEAEQRELERMEEELDKKREK